MSGLMKSLKTRDGLSPEPFEPKEAILRGQALRDAGSPHRQRYWGEMIRTHPPAGSYLPHPNGWVAITKNNIAQIEGRDDVLGGRLLAPATHNRNVITQGLRGRPGKEHVAANTSRRRNAMGDTWWPYFSDLI